MECPICFNKYDEGNHKPFSIVPCGHCFCINCLNSLTTQICPNDRSPIQAKVINRAILDLLSSSDSETAVSQSDLTEVDRNYSNFFCFSYKFKESVSGALP